MEPLEIAHKLKETFPDAVKEIKQFGVQVSVIVDRGPIRDIATCLKDTSAFAMDYLRDLCGVDYLNKKTLRFEVVYHFYSIRHRHLLRVRAEVPEDDPSIDSLVPLYRGADWHERECFDLFGITFRGHPDLRRILLAEDWDGHPLRKDYPVKGYEGDQDWPRFTQLLQKVEEYKSHEWYQR